MKRTRLVFAIAGLALTAGWLTDSGSIATALPTEQAKLTASDAAPVDEFGVSVAVSGDTAVAGARFDDDAGGNSGSAYVFVRSGAEWDEEQKLTASDAAADDRFGGAVAISGETVVVGAINGDDVVADSGAAYVFRRSGTTWTQEAKLTASDGAALDWFGRSVAIDADTVVVGAPLATVGGPFSGAAYVFRRSGTTWTQEAKLTASDMPTANDFLGWSVAISGETIVVGAFVDDAANFDAGSAYVFVRSGTTWTQEAKLTASDAENFDRFGGAVAISGDTIVVGAFLDDDVDAGEDSGSAYVFVRDPTTGMWMEKAKLTASDAAAGNGFGGAVAISSNTAVVGSGLSDDAGADSGAAYVFRRSGTSWTEEAKLTASDGAAGDLFGASVAASGDTVVVGAFLDDDAGTASGSAYVFLVAIDPQQAILDLINQVEALNLQKGIDNSLDAKLEAATRALDDMNENNDVAAINALQAFVNAVEAQSGKQISEAGAAALIATAQALIDALTGG